MTGADARLPLRAPRSARFPWAAAGRVPRLGAAPGAVVLRVDGREHALSDAGHGILEATVEAAPGADYALRARRRRAAGPGDALAARRACAGPRALLDPGAFAWTDAGFEPPALRDLVLYELHVGTFTRGGHVRRGDPAPARPARAGRDRDRADARGRVPRAATAGATTASTSAPPTRPTAVRTASSGWSTPPTARASPCSSTSSTTTSARPAARALEAFGPYFTGHYETAWGKAMNYDDAELRRRARVGAPERRAVDPRLPPRRPAARRHPLDRGLQPRAPRGGDRPPRARGATRARWSSPSPASTTRRSCAPREQGGWGCDAVWADDFHHALRVAAHRRPRRLLRRVRPLRGAGQGLPAPALPRRDLLGRSAAGASARPPDDIPPERFVVFSANHDQVGNRALGDRLPAGGPAARRLRDASGTVHADALPGRGTRRARALPVLLGPHRRGDRGRDPRGRAAASSPRSPRSRASEVPDPQDPATFERSKLTRAGEPAGLRDLHAALLRARGAAPAGRRRRGRPRRPSYPGCACDAGAYELLMNFAGRAGDRPDRRVARSSSRPRAAEPRRRRRAAPGPLRSAGPLTEVWPGRPFPLGATWDGEGTNFSLFSEHAERVELCLFDDEDTETRVELCERTAFNWHVYLPGRRARPALRLPRARALRPARGPPLQPEQAADRPLREVDRGARALERARTSCPTSPPTAPATTPTSSSTTRTTPSRSRSRSSSTPTSTGRTTARRTPRCTRASSTRRT